MTQTKVRPTVEEVINDIKEFDKSMLCMPDIDITKIIHSGDNTGHIKININYAE